MGAVRDIAHRRLVPVCQGARSAARRLRAPGEKALFVTDDDSKVLPFVNKFRSLGDLSILAGSEQQDEWLLPILNLVVTTVAKASDTIRSGKLTAHTNLVVLAESECVQQELLKEDCIPSELLLATTKHHCQGASNSNELERPALFAALPSTGFVSMFAQGLDIINQDDSAPLGFLMAVFSIMANSRAFTALFVTPANKVAEVGEFVNKFARHFGWRGLRVGVNSREADIAVVSSEQVTADPGRVDCVVFLLVDQYVHLAQQVASKLRGNVQVGVHAGVVPSEIATILHSSDRHPVTIGKSGLSLQGTRQFYVDVQDKDKLEVLCNLWDQLRFLGVQVAIFCNTQETVEMLAKKMTSRGYDSICTTHSGMSGEVLECAKMKVERGYARMLITNVEVMGLMHLINFELPAGADDYLARAGHYSQYEERVVISFAAKPQDHELLRRIQDKHETVIKPMGEDVFQALSD